MTTTNAVEFDHVSKHYRVGSGRISMTEVLTGRSRTNGASVLRALDNVTFSVPRGTTLGLIGDNGAGKTTALKLISRVTAPTSGSVQAPGRVAALIELGAGFHPELTGRENVFLSGAIYGMSEREIQRKYDRIVAFAELERFMATPVKRYSSGMYARLGFAVAAHVEPDILLVDEVLAVGDVNFQRKCLDFIQDYVRGGNTTLFVSHHLFALEQLCDRLIWLDRGQVRAAGETESVLRAYMDAQDDKLRSVARLEGAVDADLGIEDVYVSADATGPRDVFSAGEDLLVHVVYQAHRPVTRPHFVLAVWDAATRQPLFLASMLVDGAVPDRLEGGGELVCRFAAPPLMPKTYHVWGEVYGADRRSILVRWQPLAAFTVRDDTLAAEVGAGGLRHSRADAPVRVGYTWERVQ